MEQYYGMTAELYRAVTALVDDRMKEIRVVRQDFDRLVEAQARTGERLTSLEATIERLVEAQARTEARMEELAMAQARTEARMEELAMAQARTEAQLQDLIKVVGKMQDTLAAVKGRQLELTYQQKAGAYFGPLLRRLRVLSPVEIEDDLETHLSPEEFRDLLAVDLLVSGQPRYMAEAPQVWLAVEVSGIVDRHDVERARRRVASLRRAGLRAIPAVAGEDATLGAKEEAETHKVLMLQDGRAFFWDEALAEALG